MSGAQFVTTIRTHDYVDGRCQHCGDKEGDNTGEHAARSCIAREAPRAAFVSVFADLTVIGDRMKEIQAEEDRARAGGK
jgi:hypothetical protein